MAHMLQHSWLKCYTIAVIKLTKATFHFPLKTHFPRLIACSPLSPKSRYHPADQTAMTPIVTAN